METPTIISRRLVGILSIFGIAIVLINQILRFPETLFLTEPVTRVVFCDVGQGDGAYIRTKSQTDILVDVGPDTKIVGCLGRHMPLFDTHIDFIFISHPQKDHYGGLLPLIDKYTVEKVFFVPLKGSSHEYDELIARLKKRNITYDFLYQGDVVHDGKDVRIDILWPSKGFSRHNLDLSLEDSDSEGLYTSDEDPNSFSQILHFQTGDFDILFTGDATDELLHELSEELSCSKANKQSYCFDWNFEILKIPHHGSKYGLNEQFLDLINPSLSVISVGRNNRYGHPSSEVLSLLKKHNSLYLTTALQGDIRIETTGNKWKIDHE